MRNEDIYNGYIKSLDSEIEKLKDNSDLSTIEKGLDWLADNFGPDDNEEKIRLNELQDKKAQIEKDRKEYINEQNDISSLKEKSKAIRSNEDYNLLTQNIDYDKYFRGMNYYGYDKFMGAGRTGDYKGGWLDDMPEYALDDFGELSEFNIAALTDNQKKDLAYLIKKVGQAKNEFAQKVQNGEAAGINESNYYDAEEEYCEPYVKKVLEFAQLLENTDEFSQKNDAANYEALKNGSGTSKFFTSAITVFAKPTADALSAIGSVYEAVTGEIDTDSEWHALSNKINTQRSAISEGIKEDGGSSWLYNTAMSGADMAWSMLLGSGFGKAEKIVPGIMSIGAFDSTVLDAKRRGLSDAQAILLGGIAGVTEYFTEKIPFEKFLKKISGEGIGKLSKSVVVDILKSAFSQGTTEALEEGVSSVANTLADCIISQDKSQWQMKIDENMKNGQDEAEAWKNAFFSTVTDTLSEMGAGMFLGGLFGVTGSAVTYTSIQNYINSEETIEFGKRLIADGNYEGILKRADEYNVSTAAFEAELENIQNSGEISDTAAKELMKVKFCADSMQAADSSSDGNNGKNAYADTNNSAYGDFEKEIGYVINEAKDNGLDSGRLEEAYSKLKFLQKQGDSEAVSQQRQIVENELEALSQELGIGTDESIQQAIYDSLTRKEELKNSPMKSNAELFVQEYMKSWYKKNGYSEDGIDDNNSLVKNIDEEENSLYNDNRGGINENSDSKLLERRGVSAVSGNSDIVREQGTNSEKMARLVESSTSSKAKGRRIAGESDWLGSSKGKLEIRNGEQRKDSSGFIQGYVRDLSRVELKDKDTIGRTIDDFVKNNYCYTVLKADDGTILSLYHWTDAEFDEFSKGDIGFHFGTLEAAEKRKAVKGSDNSIYKEAYVNITNPVFIENDTMSWTAFSFAQQLLREGIITEQEYSDLENSYGIDFFIGKYGCKAVSQLHKLLSEKGYDGVIYSNHHEGDYSVIAFYPEQIYTVAENGIDKQKAGLDKSAFSISEESSELKDIITRLNNNENVSIDEINANSQIQEARKVADNISETYNINTPERIKLREDITNKLLDLGSYNGVDENGKEEYNGNIRNDKRLDLVIGVPAAGKSSVLVNPLSQQYESRVIDSDMAKEMLPEFNNGLGANAVHRESKNIVDEVLYNAILNGDNIVHPIVGGGNVNKLIDKIDYFKEKGYSVYLHLNELPINKAVGRAINRFIETGRFIPPEVLFDYQDKPTQNFNELKEREDLIDGYSHFSNDVERGKKPKLIEASEGVQLLFGRGQLGSGRLKSSGKEIQSKGKAGLDKSAFSIEGGNYGSTDKITFNNDIERQIYDSLTRKEELKNSPMKSNAQLAVDYLVDKWARKNGYSEDGAGEFNITEEAESNDSAFNIDENADNSSNFVEKIHNPTIDNNSNKGYNEKELENEAAYQLYKKSRPSFRKGVVEATWNMAKRIGRGIVRDPNTGEIINWKPGTSRKNVWDMGHIPEQKYSKMLQKLRNGNITAKEFRDWYNDPNNYRPELPKNNRSHRYE